jgi:predicted TPR repeat methyltransferase
MFLFRCILSFGTLTGIFISIGVYATINDDWQQPHLSSISEYLQAGDAKLMQDDSAAAIAQYEHGIHHVQSVLASQESRLNDDILSAIVSLYTNLATAYSTQGDNDNAIQSYRNAIKIYQKYTQTEEEDHSIYYDSSLITAQASFFLGMVFQDIHQPQLAVEAYTYATQLDPQHWSSYSNLGAVHYDNLRHYRDALTAYNMAYALLTDPSVDVTDPPVDASFILSQLQYRIGLCLSEDTTTQKCVVAQDDTNRRPEPGNCAELAAHAFSLAVEYDPNNESAKHMLATLTADATMNRASNVYVKDLFDQYAQNFEHSLVQELQYTGFERLRRGFDRAFLLQNKTVPHFDVVVDAGCGTGLVGEQFRNVSNILIGVDLSEVIIEKAIQTRPTLYDEVQVGDITTIFQERKGTISLMIAADSFIYFGNLDPLFESISAGLRSHDGYIAFTLENVDLNNEQLLSTTKPNWRWQLTASGRFAHRKEYVIQTGQDHGLELVHYESMGRFELE